jgi:hypothetical protein
MKPLRKAILLNLAAAVATLLALFLVPPQTPLTLFVGICLFAVSVLNAIFFVIPAIMNRYQVPRPNTFPKRQYQSYLLLAILWVYLLVSSAMSRVMALVILATTVIGGLAIWIANKSAGPNE